MGIRPHLTTATAEQQAAYLRAVGVVLRLGDRVREFNLWADDYRHRKGVRP